MKTLKKSIIMALFLFTALLLSAEQVSLSAALSNSYIPAGGRETLYLKVGLRGFKLESSRERPPINIAIVLDKSGSMSGEKIAQAKEAAIMAVNLLDSRDILSVILYDDLINVLIPATRLSDKQVIIDRLRQIESGGSTALFAGVSKGAAEVRKFLDRNRVNRVILLSDGMANVGPDTPGAFGELGSSLIKEGISVTTIGLGLGYNEDLMTMLALKSDGNHAFVENSKDLIKIFNYEFGDVLSVVAQEVSIEIQCPEGVRPIRVLGREADIAGQKISTLINQLYSMQEKYLMIELELPPGSTGKKMKVADIRVSYSNMETGTTDRLSSSIEARYTDSADLVETGINKEVMVAAVMQIATINNMEAVKLRDSGDVEAARVLLLKNSSLLENNAQILDSEELSDYAESNAAAADFLDEDSWNEQRKEMKKEQHSNIMQQSY